MDFLNDILFLYLVVGLTLAGMSGIDLMFPPHPSNVLGVARRVRVKRAAERYRIPVFLMVILLGLACSLLWGPAVAQQIWEKLRGPGKA